MTSVIPVSGGTRQSTLAYLQTLCTAMILLLCGPAASGPAAEATASRPDVLFIVVDDMNDWISLLDDEAPIATPNLQRLADRGMLFTQAYCVSPACNPSRSATLTGLRPSSTGIYGNKSDWRRAVPHRNTLMQQFRDAGYEVNGAGKVFHHQLDGAFHDDDSFDEFQPMRPQFYPPQKLNRAPEYGSRNTDWGKWPPRVEETIDYHTTRYCIDQLTDPTRDRPLFLACGIYKPHSPFFAPARYHRSYADISVPLRREDDWNDLPSGAASLLEKKQWFWRGMMEVEAQFNGSYRDFVQSYAACASFADDQIGEVLDALQQSPRRDNTIVVLWSDHGFHLGEKDHIEKFALWEKSTHVPFIVVAPGVTEPGTRCDRPIDMSVLYPTLIDLCGLPEVECDGESIVPLLRDPNSRWERPALMTYLRGNHAVRSDRWRYIRYADGSEELYDHQSDPLEWTNLAQDAGCRDVIETHRKWLPISEAEQVPDLRPRGNEQSKARSAPTNVVFILIDDLGWRDLGCYGSSYYRTPNIDRLAREGMRFTDGYAACNVCSPTRAAILTGKYPARLLLTQWLPAGRWNATQNKLREGRYLSALPLEEVTIAETMRAAGYRTGFIGKWHLGTETYYYPEHQGFDVNVAGRDYGAPGSYFYPFEGTWKIPTTGQTLHKTSPVTGQEGDYLIDRLADEAAEFIRENRDQPFFLMLSHYAVHAPLQGKPEKVTRYSQLDADARQGKPAYAAMIESVDESVGRVMNTLRELQLAERTMVVFTSDNGGFARATDNAPLRANKGSNYEGGLRVPIIIRWPGKARPGSISNEPVISTDFYPTILAATGAELRPHQHRDGKSLVPLLTETGGLQREALYWHYPHYNQHPQSFPSGVIRAGDWKLIESFEDGETQLYDLAHDIGETKNLADKRPDKVSNLKEKLRAWRAEVGADPMRPNPQYAASEIHPAQ